MMDESRRRFLKHGAATIAGTSLIGSVGSVAADPGVDPLVLKGTRERPISIDDIEKRREEYLRKHLEGRSDTLDEVVVGTPSVSGDEFVAGYGLAFENGAPVEFIRPVSAPGEEGWTVQDNKQRETAAIAAAHESVDSFASSHSGGSVSTSSVSGAEPTWDFMGWIELENQARWTYAPWGNNKRTVECGKISIKAEVHRGPAKNDGRALWIGKLVAQQWPGHVISSDKLAQTYRNAGLFMSQDWYEGHAEALEMTEFGPKIDKTAELNWSLTVGASKAGPEGGITASYDVPRMRRTNVSKNDRSVAHEYGYPSGTLERSSKASRQRVQVENVGEFVMTPPPRQQRTLFGLEMTGEFESIRNGSGFVGPDYPSKQVSVGADVSPLDLA